MEMTGSAAVLAGGGSTRFGADKAFAVYRGVPLIDFILNRLMPLFKDVNIISNDSLKYSGRGAGSFADIISDAGPLGGLHTALSLSESRYLFVSACDMPNISAGLVSVLSSKLETSSPDAAVLARDGFIEPFHAFYSIDLIPAVEDRINSGTAGLYSFLKGLNYVSVDVPSSEVFTNINHREDLQRLNS